MRKTREETLRSRLADLAAQIEQLDKARAETKAMLDVLVGLPPEQRQALEGFLETVNPIRDPETEMKAWPLTKMFEGLTTPDTAEVIRRSSKAVAVNVHTPVDDHYPLGK